MRRYVSLIKCSVILAAACILCSGCVDKKRIAELEQSNQVLESRVAKLDNDLTLALNSLRAKQAEVANLQAQIAEIQKAQQAKKATTTSSTKKPTTKKSSTSSAKKK